MKLSKAQQAVVDKMREGWELVNINEIGAPGIRLRKKHQVTKVVHNNIFKSLVKSGILEVYDDSYPIPYALTEQYKTGNNENSNTRDTAE